VVAPQPPPEPLVQVAQWRAYLGKAEERPPPPDQLTQFLHDLPDGPISGAARQRSHLRFERLQRLLAHLTPVGLAPGEREAEERAVPRPVDRALGLVDLEPKLALQKVLLTVVYWLLRTFGDSGESKRNGHERGEGGTRKAPYKSMEKRAIFSPLS
jgi:hypothetical protein